MLPCSKYYLNKLNDVKVVAFFFACSAMGHSRIAAENKKRNEEEKTRQQPKKIRLA